jgi:excisionase family DNA binding protein
MMTETMSAREAARRKGVTSLTVCHWIADGRLEAVRQGDRWAITAEALAAVRPGRRHRDVPAGLMTLDEVAHLLGFHKNTIRSWIQRGFITAQVVGGQQKYVSRAEFEAFTSKRRKGQHE